MEPSDSEERVGLLMADMLKAGRSFTPPVRPTDIRRRARWTTLPRIDTESVSCCGCCHRPSCGTCCWWPAPLQSIHCDETGDSTCGLDCILAYGLQVSVPKAWSVRYVLTCPVTSKPGTLTFGEANVPALKCEHPNENQLLFLRPSPTINVSEYIPARLSLTESMSRSSKRTTLQRFGTYHPRWSYSEAMEQTTRLCSTR